MLRIKDKRQVYKVAINAAMGSFLYGYQLVNISSLEGLFRNMNELDPRQTQIMISIITAALPLTAILGALLLKSIMKKIKAKYLMILMDLLTIVGILIEDISLSFLPLVMGRLILGFSVGINSGLVPQYIYSVTPTALAGSIGAMHQVFFTVGVAIGYTFGFIIVPTNIDDTVNWRILLSLPIITCTIRSTLLLTLLPYEIPSHRLKDKQVQRLQKYYYKIYENYNSTSNSPSRNSQAMLSTTEIDNLSEQNNPEQHKSFFSALQQRNLSVCIILACSNQLCGINAILFYAKQLFMKITNNNNDLSQMIIILLGVVQIVATLVGGSLMDKYPKKPFLIIGQLAMVICLFSIFAFDGTSQLLIITLIFTHTIAYSFSVGQLLMYYAAKMLDSTGHVIMVNWSLTFLVAISAQFMMKDLGIGKMCLIFGILLSVCLVYLFRSIPGDGQIQAINQQLLKKPVQTLQLQDTKQSRETGISVSEQSQTVNQFLGYMA